MKRMPRDPREPILTRTLMWRIAIVGFLLLLGAFGLFEYELATGAGIAEARTVAVNVFVMGELFYLFNCRSLTKSVFEVGFSPISGCLAERASCLFYSCSLPMCRS